MIRTFGAIGSGPELADAMLAEYRLRHNLDVGTKNRHGTEFRGHYDPWLVQYIDHLRQKLSIDQTTRHLAVDINALNYKGPNEVFGICPMPEAEMSRLNIEKCTNETSPSFNERDLTIPKLEKITYIRIGTTQRKKHHRYHYVANRQNAKFAVPAVHTLEEIFLFTQFMSQIAKSNFGGTCKFFF